MSLYDKVGIAAGFGAIITANAAFPALIPYTLAGVAIGGGSVLVGSYVSKKIRHKAVEQEPASEEITETEAPESLEQVITKTQHVLPALQAMPDSTPKLIRMFNGWDAVGCPPKPKDKNVYDYTMEFLSQNEELILCREKALTTILRFDPGAKFYFSEEQDCIYVVGSGIPANVESWEPPGAKYVISKPPKGSCKLEPIVEGYLAGDYNIYLKKPLEGSPAVIKDALDIMTYLNRGIVLHLKK